MRSRKDRDRMRQKRYAEMKCEMDIEGIGYNLIGRLSTPTGPVL